MGNEKSLRRSGSAVPILEVKMNRRGFLLGGGALASGSLVEAAAGWDNERLVTERITVPVRGGSASWSGLKIVALGDFHLHPYTTLPFLRRAFEMARQLNPDVIVLLGDFVDSTVEAMDEMAPHLGELNAKHGVFAVLGNHDLRKGGGIVASKLEGAGVKVLRNRGVLIPVGGASVWLCGMDSYIGEQHLPRALEGGPASAVGVLLAHEPDVADAVAQSGRVHLQLSGHSHGGQVNIPGLVWTGLPSMARKYPFGSYSIGPMFLHTNRGIGMTQWPVRYRSAPEVSEVLLRPV
jgi:predicted MPP superfamily phosphohydrolase